MSLKRSTRVKVASLNTPFDAPLYFYFAPSRVKVLCMIEGAEESVDADWMRLALRAAREAEERGEVPIGACVVAGDKLLAAAGNRTRTDCDPTAHAEIIALREAAHTAGNYRLTDATVYSTVEPCAMCAGALIQARVQRLVYGARDERAGAVDTNFQICASSSLNHQIIVTSGVLEEECRTIMQDFFRARRNSKDESRRQKDEKETMNEE